MLCVTTEKRYKDTLSCSISQIYLTFVNTLKIHNSVNFFVKQFTYYQKITYLCIVKTKEADNQRVTTILQVNPCGSQTYNQTIQYRGFYFGKVLFLYSYENERGIDKYSTLPIFL